jgi:hypothetical protein
MEARMFDRLVEDFCQFDDFCQAFYPRWEAAIPNAIRLILLSVISVPGVGFARV